MSVAYTLSSNIISPSGLRSRIAPIVTVVFMSLRYFIAAIVASLAAATPMHYKTIRNKKPRHPSSKPMACPVECRQSEELCKISFSSVQREANHSNRTRVRSMKFSVAWAGVLPFESSHWYLTQQLSLLWWHCSKRQRCTVVTVLPSNSAYLSSYRLAQYVFTFSKHPCAIDIDVSSQIKFLLRQPCIFVSDISFSRKLKPVATVCWSS